MTMNKEEKLTLQRAQIERDVAVELASRGLTGERLRDAATVFMAKSRPTFDAAGELDSLTVSGERFSTARHAVDRFVADAPWVTEGATKPGTSPAMSAGSTGGRALVDMPLEELATLSRVVDTGPAIARAERGK